MSTSRSDLELNSGWGSMEVGANRLQIEGSVDDKECHVVGTLAELDLWSE